MLFALALSVNKNVIKVYYYDNVKFFCENLVDITLKRGWYVGQSKRYDLVFEVAIASLESRLPFVFFPNLHLMIGIGQIELGKLLSPA